MNIQTIEAILDTLNNLKCLCIYSCPLIDLSQVRAVIRLIGAINMQRIKSNRPLLDLDIAPPFRQGPVRDRMGSYGITHSDPTLHNNWRTDVGHALAASLVSLLREADNAYIQLCQPGKAFRLWLDKLPLNINQAENLCLTAANYLSNTRNRVAYAHEVYRAAEDTEARAQLLAKFDDTVGIDLVAAATAEPVSIKDFRRQGKFHCTKCDETLPGILFRAESQVRRPQWVTCEGCELNYQLDYESGNNQFQNNQLATFLWRDAPLLSLDWLFGDSVTAVRNWTRFFVQAKKMPTPEELLREAEDLNDQRQSIVNLMNLLCNWKEKKSLDEEKKRLEKAIENLRVRAGFQRTPTTCLATTYDWDYRRKAYNWRGEVERGEYCPDRPYDTQRAITHETAFNMWH
jgi:hypothetical protein